MGAIIKDFIKEWAWPVFKWMCIATIGAGILLWLQSKQIYPAYWVAAAIGYAESVFVTTAAWLILVGLFGLFVPYLWRLVATKGRLLLRASKHSASTVNLKTEYVPLQLPYDIDARSALLYAANGTWAPRSHNKPVNSETAGELRRMHDALDRFYEYASHDDGLRVWGRTSMSKPPKLVEQTHWQDWHIDYTSLFSGPDAEPLRTVPIAKLPSNSSPYYDLRLNKAEVERIWPHELVPILEAARICFEETGLLGDEEIGGDIRLYQFVVFLVIEANRNPHLLSIWGKQLPSTKMARIPTERLVTRCLRENGAEIYAEIGFHWQREWINVSVRRDELPSFIERLKKNQTAGQQSADQGAH